MKHHFLIVLLICFSINFEQLHAALSADCAILEEFYNNNGGRTWTNTEQGSLPWIAGTNCCVNWFGITCNANSQVLKINIGNNNVQGTLTNSNFWSLPALYKLDVSMNDMTGEVPQSLVSIPTLNKLYLDSNVFTGTFPNFSNCANLEIIDVSGNKFSGPLPNMQQCTQLQSIDFSFNYFSGSLPNYWDALPSLQYLHVESNQLSGSLPPTLFNLTSIVYLVMSDNNITDTLPIGFTRLKSLQFLDLSQNNLYGTLDPSIFPPLSASLKFLDLSVNKLSGPIPQELFGVPVDGAWQSSSLVQVSLFQNQFSGTILNMENSQFLLQFDAHENMISGFNTSFDYLISLGSPLTFLDLSNNLISSDLGQLSLNRFFRFLKYLILSDNPWSPMPLPANIASLTGLQQLEINNTPLRAGTQSPADSVLVVDPNGPYTFCGVGCICLGTNLLLGNGLSVSASVDPAYFNYEYCTCTEGNYYNVTLGSDARSCAPCLPNALCPGLKPSCTNETCYGYNDYHLPTVLIYPNDGHFLLPSATTAAYVAECKAFPKMNWACNATHQAALGYTALDGSEFTCRESYQGPMCSRCADNYFLEGGGFCLKCPAQGSSPSFLAVFMFGGVIALLYFFSLKPENTGLAKVTTNYWNIMLVVTSSQNLPDEILSSTNFMSFVQLSFASLRCIYPGYDFITNFYVATTLPFVLALTIGFIYFVGLAFIMCRASMVRSFLRVFGREGFFQRMSKGREFDRVALRGAWIRKNLHVFMMVMCLMYFGLCMNIFQMFRCIKPVPWDSEMVLLRFPYVSCSDVRYLAARDVAAFYVVLYVVGIPAVLIGLLAKNSAEVKRYMFSHGGGMKSAEANIFGFMYLPYKPSYWWWEGLEFFVRIALTLNFCTLDFNSTGNKVLLSAFVVGKVLAHFIAHPYNDQKLDALDCFGNLVILAYMVLGAGYTTILDQSNILGLTVLLNIIRYGFLVALVPPLIFQFIVNLGMFGRGKSMSEVIRDLLKNQKRQENSADIYSLMERQ